MAKDIHFIHCFGGNKNFGDDYILDAWIRRLQKDVPDRIVISGSPWTWQQSQFLGGKVYFNDFLIRFVSDAIRGEKTRSGTDNLNIDRNIAAGARAARQLLSNPGVWADLLGRIGCFHVAGGGYLNTIFGTQPASFAMVSMLAGLSAALDVPLYGTGLGLLPLEKTDAVVGLLDRFDLIESRDEEGDAYLRDEFGLTNSVFGLDDTFVMPVAGPRRQAREPAVFVDVQADMGGAAQHSAYLDAVTRLLGSLGPDVPVHYLTFSQSQDRPFLRKLETRVSGVTTHSWSSLILEGLPVQADDLVITSRFHCHLLSSRRGARGVYISARPGYYDIKHGSIAKLGSNWININEAGTIDYDLNRLEQPAMREQKRRRDKTATIAPVVAHERLRKRQPA